jgi:hypothetical protein
VLSEIEDILSVVVPVALIKVKGKDKVIPVL